MSALRSFAREINCAPQEVTEKLIITWAGTKEWSPETRHSKFCTLRSFYAWYSPLNEITNPALHLPSIRRFIPPPRPTPENVFKDALHSANKRTQLILKLAGNYGLRAGEIAIVHQHDIGNDTSEPYLTVHGKGNKDRVIPITTTFYEEMLLHVNTVTGWLFPGNFHGHLSPRWISKIGSKALPRGWTLHTLRHRCGTRAYAVQHDLLAVQTLLGHEKVSTTQRYVLPNETGMRTAIESIELTL
ncbi:tyrosine-type recombinase/integrase [Actinotignum urinale]|uniref:tyrosine-type recombinase/integrase n=1 Tax=Actinotignum urinale TaxID=190146 RepID=UPI002A905062|nr:tyrosine-type recombinase/integrase [Actinotignum urinale]